MLLFLIAGKYTSVQSQCVTDYLQYGYIFIHCVWFVVFKQNTACHMTRRVALGCLKPKLSNHVL